MHADKNTRVLHTLAVIMIAFLPAINLSYGEKHSFCKKVEYVGNYLEVFLVPSIIILNQSKKITICF